MDAILVPGFWLDASSWDAVLPPLVEAGHRVHPLTRPGLTPDATDRGSITLADQVAAVVAAIDGVDTSAGPVALVGHSGGGPMIYAAAEQRPDRVARLVYVDTGPVPPGAPINPDLPVVDGEIPLPDWSVFDAEDLVDLDDDLRAAFRARAIPEPARSAGDPQPLDADGTARYGIPVTVICCEFPSSFLRGAIESGHPWAAELAHANDVELVDLPTGHWPQFTRPLELGRAIAAAIG